MINNIFVLDNKGEIILDCVHSIMATIIFNFLLFLLLFHMDGLNWDSKYINNVTN